jgi:hypothetical protein
MKINPFKLIQDAKQVYQTLKALQPIADAVITNKKLTQDLQTLTNTLDKAITASEALKAIINKETKDKQ